MADRYWVGGTAAWDGTAGTKWSATSGGAGGASVPTSADAVFFTNLSTGTCTVLAGNTGAASVDCTGFTGTLTGSAGITVAGSFTLSAGMTHTRIGLTTFTGTGTLTTAGKPFPTIVVNGSGITLTLGDALTSPNGGLTVTTGGFDSAGYSLTRTNISSSNSNNRTINLRASTVTLTGVNDPQSNIDFTTSTNLTFDAGTSLVRLTTTYPKIYGSGQTFYDVEFPASDTFATNPREIRGANSFRNLAFECSNSIGTHSIVLYDSQFVSGTFTVRGNATSPGLARAYLQSSSSGVTRTVTANAIVSTDCDFLDIAIAGSAADTSLTRAGNLARNSGITFPAAKTVYRVGTSTGWRGNSWATTSGGAANGVNFPLAQDTAVIDNNTALTGTLSFSDTYYGSFNASARTTGITFSFAMPASRYGSFILGSGVTVSGTSLQAFAGSRTMGFSSAGKTVGFGVSVNALGGTFRLGDAFSSTASITHTQGAFDANNYNLTCATFASSNSNVRTINFGSGTWVLTGTGTAVWNAVTATNLAATGTGAISLTSASAKSFQGGGIQTYPTLNQGGAGTLTVTGSNKFAAMTNTAIGRVQFIGGSTNEFAAFNLNGVSGNLLQLGSTTTAQAILKLPSLSVGANSVDAGNNTGLSFTAGSVDYLSVSYINGQIGALIAFVLEGVFASDTASVAASAYSAAAAESTTASDALLAGLTFSGTLSESATAADVTAAVRLYLASIEEATTASDLVSAALVFVVAVSDLTTASDAQSPQKTTNPAVAEIAQMADALSGGLLFSTIVAEAASLADTAAAGVAFNRAVAEFARGEDASQVVASIFGAAAADTAQARDTAQGANTGSSNLSESAVGSDADATQFVPSTSVSEAAQGAESTASLAVFRGPVLESAVAQDQSSVAPSNFSAVALAVAQALDVGSPAGSVYNAALPIEGAGITDSLIGAYLWNLIDDNQSVNWQNADTAQGSGWVQLGTDDNPNWQLIIAP